MATFKVLNGKNKFHNEDARTLLFYYITNSGKTPSGYIGYFSVNPFDPVADMNNLSERYNKNFGVQLRHYVISFAENEQISAATANEIARKICEFIGREYQVMYAVHETKNIHIHIMANSVSFITGRKYSGSKTDFYILMNKMRQITGYYHVYLKYVSNRVE